MTIAKEIVRKKLKSVPTKATASLPIVDELENLDFASDILGLDLYQEEDVKMTKECFGDTERYCRLEKLNSTHYGIINSPVGWLNCDIIQQVHVCLKNCNPAIEGLQRPILGPIRNFEIVTGEFVQILHTDSNHWVCTSNIGCLPGVVNFYDSLYHNIISNEVEEQVKCLVGADVFVGINVVPVQQQRNGFDCGVFAAAFATCLAHYTAPETVE